MKTSNHKKTATIIAVLLIINLATWTTSPIAVQIRDVDFIRIFATGVLAGMLVLTLVNLYRERKTSA